TVTNRHISYSHDMTVLITQGIRFHPTVFMWWIGIIVRLAQHQVAGKAGGSKPGGTAVPRDMEIEVQWNVQYIAVRRYQAGSELRIRPRGGRPVIGEVGPI